MKRLNPWSIIEFIVLAMILYLLAAIGESQPLGPHGELVYSGFWQGSGGALHETLFSSQDCANFPNPCASFDAQIPIDCTEAQDGSAYAKWAYGAICQACVPTDIRPIIARIPAAFPKQSDFDAAGALIVQTVSWTINPHMACSVWREQLRVYFCQQTTAVDGRARCIANGYTKPGTQTRTPTKGTPAWTPTLSPAPSRTVTRPALTSTASTTPASSVTPSRLTPTPTPCSPGETKVIGGAGVPPVLLVCVGGVWTAATPTLTPAPIRTATPRPPTFTQATAPPLTATSSVVPVASPTPTARTIVVPPRPTIGNAGGTTSATPLSAVVSPSSPAPTVAPASSPTAPPGTGKYCGGPGVLVGTLLAMLGVVVWRRDA